MYSTNPLGFNGAKNRLHFLYANFLFSSFDFGVKNDPFHDVIFTLLFLDETDDF